MKILQECKTEYLEHTVTELDDSGIQYCVKCSEIISDYRGTVSFDGSIPKGFAAGTVYVTVKGNPRITTTFLGENEIAYDCMNPIARR